MSKPNVSKFFKDVQASLVKHSPEILTGIGIAGMLTTTVLAVQATPKAVRLLEQEREYRRMDRENGVDESIAPDKISAIDTIKICWKSYIPAAVTCGVSIACIIGASSVHARRNTALATAYKLSETALSEYREKVVETIGEKQEKLIQEKVDKERIEKNPVSKNEVIITEKGNTLCYDPISDRYFKSDIEKIRRAENTLNKRMMHDLTGYITLNDWYDELGLHRLNNVGDDLGWNTSRGLLDIDFSSQIADDGTPCIVLNYIVAPRRDYLTFV